MESKAEIILTIDGEKVVVPDGTTILEAARLKGIRIPTLCHHPSLTPWGGCRLCMVQVDGSPKLVASCVMPVRNGMEVVTSNEAIIETRRTILEFLFSERNHYCMFCAQSGDCELQNLAYEYQMDHLTVPPLDQAYPVDSSHEDLVFDHNRCVLCGRCARACHELAGQSVLSFQNRGAKTLVGVDLAGGLGESTCVSCGLCLQVCPTGAIFLRHRTHYAVKGKPKDWDKVETYCPECGLLCPIVAYTKGNNLLKIEGVLGGEQTDRGQLCRKGRFDPLKTVGPRLLEPMVRGEDGRLHKASWDEALERAAAGLKGVVKSHGAEAVIGLVSSRCGNEDLAGFKDLMNVTLDAGLVDTLDGRHFRTVFHAENGGPAVKEASWDLIADADFILQIGANPTRTHPIVNALTQRAVLEKHAAVAVIGPENPLGHWADVHLAVEGDELLKVMKTLGTEVQGGSGSDIDSWKAKGVGDVARLFQEAKTPIIVVGEGLTGLSDPSGLQAALNLARMKKYPSDGRLPIIILKPFGNSAGAWGLGLAARQGVNGQGRFKGAVVCLSGDEAALAAYADSLNTLDFLTVLTPYLSESLAATAQVLLPTPIWMESDGTFARADGSGTRYKTKLLTPPSGVQPAERTLRTLSERVGAS